MPLLQVLRAIYRGREVALKVAGEINANITSRQRRDAERELDTLRSLHHDCIVQVTTTSHARPGHSRTAAWVPHLSLQSGATDASDQVHVSASRSNTRCWSQHLSVQLIVATRWQGQLGILMELMSGGDLHAALSSDAVVWGPIALGIAVDIATGLAYLHQHEIAHLDLKPSNILITK